MEGERLITVADVAKRLSVDPETVRVWLRTGKIQGSRIGGKRAGWRVPESEVMRIVEQEKPPPRRGSTRLG